jgi:hypothetical protein
LLLVFRVAVGDSARSGPLTGLFSWKRKLDTSLLKPRPDANAATVRAGLRASLPNDLLALTRTELLEQEQKYSASAERRLRMAHPAEIF